ncbi:MAG: hypothetical protein CSA50_00005 [Gammaproteobacteria bacterium]|nr:MAG: hypothetical protein CSA50_00005 [Gammaproteobacteria bacterium]
MQIIIKRILVLGISLALLIGSVSLRLGNVAPDDIRNTPLPGSIDAWHTIAETELLKYSTTELEAGNIEQARHYAFAALRTNPGSGRAARHLLEVYKKAGDTENGDKVAMLASALWPADSLTRAGLADYWLSRNNLEKLLPEWNNVLIRHFLPT